MAIEGVAATRLCNGVSITFVREDGGWRFSAWSAEGDSPLLIKPAPHHTQRYFAAFFEGVTFFRDVYALALNESTSESQPPRD